MHRNRMVMRIFRRSSGTWKIVKTWFIGTSTLGPPSRKRHLYHLGRPWLHLVSHRLLRGRDHDRLATGFFDLLFGRRRKMVRVNDQFLGTFSAPEDAQVLLRALEQADGLQRTERHLGPGITARGEGTDV